MNKRAIGSVVVALACVAAGATPSTPQTRPSAAMEPEAVTALRQMGSYLRSLKAFQVEAVTSEEDVLEDGQKVQFTSTTDMVARMPDRLRVDVDGDRRDRLFVYDGKSVTMLARKVNLYVTVPAPSTIGATFDMMDEKYDLQLPLEDLFRWGGPQSKDDDITSAMVIGPSEVGGVTCGHYAFRQQGIDWQVWIQLGDYPLPRKLVITTTTDEARPQYQATFTWNLAPSFNDDAFTFVAPAGAGRATIAEVK